MQKKIKFFKILYAFYPDWTIQEAAHLFCGKRPKRKKPLPHQIKIKVRFLEKNFASYFSQNSISSTYRPLFSKRSRLILNKNFLNEYKGEMRDLDERFPTASFLEAVKQSGFEYDRDIEVALKWCRKTIFTKTDNTGQIDGAFYLEASQIVSSIYGEVPNPQMAEILRKLVRKLNRKHDIYLPELKIDSIIEHLRGHSKAQRGRPFKDRPPIEIDWKSLLKQFKP